MLMITVQMPGVTGYDNKMTLQTLTVNKDTSLAMELQKKPLGPSRKNGVMDQDKYRKWSIQRNWTDHDYHVQDINYVSHTTVKNYVQQHSLLNIHFVGRMRNPMECGI